MKHIIILAPFSLTIVSTGLAGTFEMTVKGLSCPFCIYGVEKNIKKISGVASVDTDYKKATVTIEMKKDAAIDFQEFRKAVIDADVRYKINTEGGGTDHGDDLFYNIAYQHRVYPWMLPETGISHQLNVVLELNGQWTQKDQVVGGATDPNSGGNTLFLSPGLQYVTKRVILELSFQYPIAQDLNENQLKKTFAVGGGMRVQF